MRKLALALSAAAMTVTAIPVAADARPPRHSNAREYRAQDRGYDRGYQQGYDRAAYDSRGRYRQPHRVTNRNQVFQGRNGQYYCRRDNGTTGTLIGAGVGALAGNQVADRGQKTLGTIVGALGGGLLGRIIDRGDIQCR